MSYQKTIICGNVGQDAEIRVTGNGNKAIGFSVAVNRKYVDANGVINEETTWYNCTKWVGADGSTEVAKYVKAGAVVCVDGVISAHAFKNKENNWVASLDLRVERLQLVSSSSKKTED